MIESWKLSVSGSCCLFSPSHTLFSRKGSTLGARQGNFAGKTCSAPKSILQRDVRRGTENPTCEGESDLLMACAYTRAKTQAGAKRKRQPAAARAAAVCLVEKTLRIARVCFMRIYMQVPFIITIILTQTPATHTLRIPARACVNDTRILLREWRAGEVCATRAAEGQHTQSLSLLVFQWC